MNIGFIGAGKVGCSFGHYLKQQGFSIVGYHSRTRESSFYAANLTRSSPLNFGELIKKSNYIFITTPDDQIEHIWNKMMDFDLSNKKIFHMSGCLSSAIFTNCKDKGALCYSLHPLFSFAAETPTAKADGVLRYYIDFFNTLTILNIVTTH